LPHICPTDPPICPRIWPSWHPPGDRSPSRSAAPSWHLWRPVGQLRLLSQLAESDHDAEADGSSRTTVEDDETLCRARVRVSDRQPRTWLIRSCFRFTDRRALRRVPQLSAAHQGRVGRPSLAVPLIGELLRGSRVVQRLACGTVAREFVAAWENGTSVRTKSRWTRGRVTRADGQGKETGGFPTAARFNPLPRIAQPAMVGQRSDGPADGVIGSRRHHNDSVGWGSGTCHLSCPTSFELIEELRSTVTTILLLIKAEIAETPLNDIGERSTQALVRPTRLKFQAVRRAHGGPAGTGASPYP
jgi:hypothetical protein